MRRNMIGLLLACLLLLSPIARAEVVERIAAVVNDEIILLSEVKEQAQSYQSMLVGIRDPEQLTTKKNEIYTKVLDQLIEDMLLEQQLKELKFDVDEKEVDAAIERVMAQNNIPDKETLKKALFQQGIEWTEYRKQIGKQLRKWNFINAKVGNRVKISEAEVKTAYEKENISAAQEYEYRARHILFRLLKSDTAEVEQAQRQRAEDALARYRSGEDFEALARELSEGPTARFGGDLGYFRKGVMVKAFENAVLKLSVNEVSPVVKSPFGFHVIQLADKRPVPPKGYEEARAEISARLREEAMKREMKTWVQQLRSKAFIDIKMNQPPKQAILDLEESGQENQ